MSPRDLEQLITATGTEAEDLQVEADRIRRLAVGDEVHLRGIIEFSSYCRCHCAYCGLRADNKDLRRYRMRPEEIVQAAEEAEHLGLGTVVLQSGEDEAWTASALAEVIAEIKARTSLAVTLSVGEREEWEYRLWREAGADRYLLKHETADRDLYARLHPGASFENRLRCLETLFELGYQVGSGCIVGLPGQTPRSLAEDLLLLRRLGVHMVGLGPLIPHPQTPLADMPVGPAQVTLNLLALTRLLIPDVMLAATTALETAMPGGRLAGLRAGANVVMPNITPRQYASFYEIYPDRAGARLAQADEVEKARQVIAAAGRVPARGPGHSPRVAVCGGPRPVQEMSFPPRPPAPKGESYGTSELPATEAAEERAPVAAAQHEKVWEGGLGDNPFQRVSPRRRSSVWQARAFSPSQGGKWK